jgi:DNA-binding NtrC family response regulator
VERGEFREDLYYRLCGVALEVPALRERPSDVPLLARALLIDAQQGSGLEPKPLSREALSALGRHTWPGNVRELENALRVAGLFARGPEIEPCDFTDNVEGLRHLRERGSSQGTRSDAGLDRAPPSSSSRADSTPSWPAPPESVPPCSTDVVYAEVRGGTSLGDLKHRLEQECISRALAEAGGNITRAAALLGMKRPRLSQLVKQYQLGTVVAEEKKS